MPRALEAANADSCGEKCEASGETEQWYYEELSGYEKLYAKGREAYYYSYNEMNKRHGYRHIQDRVFQEALGLGCAYGDEFEPFAQNIHQIIILCIEIDLSL